MKRVIIITAVCLAAVILFSVLYFTVVKPNKKIGGGSASGREFLSVNGTKIVNGDGETVRLVGVNLGGWLLQEYWMCPVQGNPVIEQWTESQTIETLEKRFGADKALELMETYRDNWITEWDIQNLSSIGVNVLRVPFWYRNFMSDAYGTYLTENDDENPGFKHLDWIIETAEKYGIYIILDMHGCPGGQSLDHCTGTYKKASLYTDAKCREAMKSLWLKISDRYKNNSTVAAYDIMNEPYLDSFNGGDNDMRNIIYNEMYDAIRQNGDEHIVIFEGIWQLKKLPTPDGTKTNLVYEVHPYGDFDAEDSAKAYFDYSTENNIPVYIGEFSDMALYPACEKYGISCTAYTYKGSVDNSQWFMYSTGNLSYADVINDSFDTIKAKWGSDALATVNFNRQAATTEYYDKKSA